MAAASCFSILLCRRKKKPLQSRTSRSQKSHSQDFDKISPRVLLNSKLNFEASYPHTLRVSLPQIDTQNIATLASHRSSIVVKSPAGFLPLSVSQEKNETTAEEYTNRIESQRVSTADVPLESFNSLQKSKGYINSNLPIVTWSKKYSRENPLANLNRPFLSNNATHRPKLVPITPENLVRRKLFPKMSNCIIIKKEPIIAVPNYENEKQIFHLNLDEYDGDSSDSLVNL